MNAQVDIEGTLMSAWREVDEPFKPSKTSSSQFNGTTNIDTYKAFIPGFAISIWNYVLQERSVGPYYRTVDIHFKIRVQNVTHPATAAGVVPLSKAAIDFHLTELQLTGPEVIQTHLLSAIDTVKRDAKY